MNNERRKKIDKITKSLANIQDEIECISLDEQMSYDNLPEALQESKKGEEMLDAIDNLSQASAYVGDAVDSLCDAAL